MEKTYNLGRAVGWSNYEEFLKENPNVDPATVTRFVYETLVTYGVTRVVELSATDWHSSNGGLFYTQTIRVPGASWGAVPIVGLDYEYYMQVFTNPAALGMTDKQKEAEAAAEVDDVTDKNAVETAIGNIFGVYVSDSQGCKTQSSSGDHGYLTFMAHPDILKFQDDVPGLDGSTLRLIVRGLSLEDLIVDELYFGPQGFVFAGNGLIEDCYHRTENINNLMLAASSYIELAITGNAISDGAAYTYYHDVSVQLEGVVSGYVDLETLGTEGYLMTASEIAAYITAASTAGVYLTKAAYGKIPDDKKDDYLYMIYGSIAYTDYPKDESPIYILCIRKTDGYAGMGVMLKYGTQATVGYDAAHPDVQPKKKMNLLHISRTDKNKVITLKDKFMPDYLGSYWGKDDGWDGNVCYLQQNGLRVWEWQRLKEYYGAIFHEAGRNSYITAAPTASRPAGNNIQLGDFILITGEFESGENAVAIRGMYVCTESCDTDSDSSVITLHRRGGYLRTKTRAPGPTASAVFYCRLPQWSYTLHSPSGEEPYITGHPLTSSDYDEPNRIYQNELIYVQQPNDLNDKGGLGDEWQVINIATSGSVDFFVRTDHAFPLSDASSGVSAYSGTVIHSKTNAIKRSTLADLMPTVVMVNDSPHSINQQILPVSRGGNCDIITVGTIVSLKHTVSGVFGKGVAYWYQYIGTISNNCVLACSTSQKDGTTFYTLAQLTSHLNQGFPRSKQNIPQGNSWFYNYPKTISRMTVAEFFGDFGLDITDYLHPDFRNTSYMKFLQNLVSYHNLGLPASTTNKKQLGFSADYRFFTKNAAQSIVTTQPTESNPVRTSLILSAATDPTSFTSPGFFTAQHINPQKIGYTWYDNPTDEPHNIANPEYPIWATIAKSRNGEQTMSISLIDDEGSRLNDSGSEGTIEADTVTPHDWLVALALGKSVDVLKGMRVQRAGTTGNYIETIDNRRIYFAATEPDPNALDIPVDSIGIGW